MYILYDYLRTRQAHTVDTIFQIEVSKKQVGFGNGKEEAGDRAGRTELSYLRSLFLDFIELVFETITYRSSVLWIIGSRLDGFGCFVLC